MVTALHPLQPPNNNSIHTPINWTYANAVDRLSATGLIDTDLLKFCLQVDTNEVYMLIDTFPTWQFIGGGNGLQINVSAGTVSNNLTNLVFSNANGVSFGLSGSTITATVNPGAAAGIAAIQAGTETQTNGTFVFSNSNGLTFGLSNSTITGRYTVPSTAGLISNINISAGTTSNNLTNLSFRNSNNVSFGLNGSTLTASAGGISNTVFFDGNNTVFGSSGTFAPGQMRFSVLDAGNIRAGYTNGSVIIAGLNFSVSAGTQSNSNASSLIFSNSNNVSFGLITGTITASASFPAQTAFVFSNSNGISFGTNASTVTASYTVPSTAGLISKINVSAGTTSNNLTNFVFSNSNGLSFGLNGSTVTGSYTVPSTAGLISNINISAGTTSNNVSNFVISNSNNMSFGLSGSTITAFAHPKASEVSNDATIAPGTNLANTVDDLMQEFPLGNVLLSPAGTYSLSTTVIGRVILLNASGTFTANIPTNASSNIPVGSSFTIIQYVSGSNIVFTTSSGVSILNTFTTDINAGTKYKITQIATDIWYIQKIAVTNNTIWFPLDITHQNSFWEWTAGAGMISTGTGEVPLDIQFPLGPFPGNCLLKAITISINPGTGRSGLPHIMPKLTVYRNAYNTTPISPIAAQSDLSATLTAYQQQHSITATIPGGLSGFPTDLNNFWIIYSDEAGTNAQPGTILIALGGILI